MAETAERAAYDCSERISITFLRPLGEGVARDLWCGAPKIQLNPSDLLRALISALERLVGETNIWSNF